ncbi:MAG: hypothetical protein PHT02_00060 [Tissierellia bacterium]|nr:hypothetical protein [Tissierellia bacterium]
MTVNKVICSMYANSPESIETDFILIYEGDIVIKGKTVIKDYLDTIELNGNCEDINIRKFIDENETIICVNANDLPRYYTCELTNFPIDNRKNEFVNKDIIIKFPKVMLHSNFTFNMSCDYSSFNFDMQPLYETETVKMCDIILQ